MVHDGMGTSTTGGHETGMGPEESMTPTSGGMATASGMAGGELGDAEMPGGAGMDDGGMRDGMGGGGMDDGGSSMAESAMPSVSGMEGENDDERVLVEVRAPQGLTSFSVQTARDAGLEDAGLTLDADYQPVPMAPNPDDPAAAPEGTYLVRGTIGRANRRRLEAHTDVVRVYTDARIEPFGGDCGCGSGAGDGAGAGMTVAAPPQDGSAEASEFTYGLPRSLGAAAIPCPISPCDCTPGTAKGDMTDVRRFIGVDDIWSAGITGRDVVVAVVDGGLRAEGRATGSGRKLANVIGGWPSDWGKRADWGEHGMMSATDVRGMAKDCKLVDIRISGSNYLSEAIQGYDWCLQRYRSHGYPHVITNSWGIFQDSWAPDYARDPNHPFTRKVVEAVDAGIVVLFAAGNCGGTCPDGRCGPDVGPGSSIWGANGHPKVITVGAVNPRGEYIGYSSQGPAALDPRKPDFCSISHFQGYFASDSGTSAATPVAAGVAALMKQAKPNATTSDVKQAITSTARDIGPAGWDKFSGAGIIQAKAAFDTLRGSGGGRQWRGWERLGGSIRYGVGVSSWAANRLDCFAVGNDHAMWHKWWDGSTWRGWENLGGSIVSAPAAVSWGRNRIDAFAIGTNSRMYHKWWDGSRWRGWEDLSGTCRYGAAAASWAANRLDIFTIGTNRALYHKWWDGNRWRGWENLGGVCVGPPAAVSWGPNRIDVFVIGGNSHLYHKYWNGSAWRGFYDLGGSIQTGVGVSSWAPNRLDVFALGNDHAMWHKWWDGSRWLGWERLGGVCAGGPAAVSWGPNRIDTFVVGMDSAMYHKWYT